MNTSLETVTAITAIVTAITAITTAVASFWAILRQSWLVRHSISVDLLWKLDEQFASDTRMLNNRRNAAQSLIVGMPTSDLDKVIDFFEGLGIFLHKGLIDEEMVWSHFSYWAVKYWLVSRQYVETIRREEPTVWTEVEYLFERMCQITAQKQGKSRGAALPSEESLKEFLQEEAEVA